MKFIISLVVLSATAALAFNDNRGSADISAASGGSAFLTFTDRNSYNPWGFAGSPVGLLPKLTVPLKLDFGYRMWNLHQSSAADSLPMSLSAGIIPRIALGVPQTAYLIGSYLPYTMKKSDTTMAVQRFGVILAAGSPDGIFGFALKADGFLGRLKPDTTWYRQILDIEDVSVYFGSRIADMISLGVHAGASGSYDSLVHVVPGDTLHDRYFSSTIPRIGGDIDFDLPNFPLSSNFAIDFGTNCFLYATQRNHLDNSIVTHAIKADSLNWNWQGMLTVSTDSFFITPAMGFGYWRSNTQIHDTANKNQDPFHLGAAYPDSTWKFTFLHWGFGGTLDFRHLVTGTLEYTNGAFTTTYGSALRGSNVSSTKQRPMHRTAIGITANLQNIRQLRFPPWLEVALHSGYFNELGSSRIDAYRADDRSFFDDGLLLDSQHWRYNPDSCFAGYERIQRFSLGLGASVFDHMAGLDTYIAWLGEQTYTSLKGIEFGIDLEYQLKMPR